MICPKCQSPTRVRRTVQMFAFRNRRERNCLGCGLVMETTEAITAIDGYNGEPKRSVDVARSESVKASWKKRRKMARRSK